MKKSPKTLRTGAAALAALLMTLAAGLDMTPARKLNPDAVDAGGFLYQLIGRTSRSFTLEPLAATCVLLLAFWLARRYLLRRAEGAKAGEYLLSAFLGGIALLCAAMRAGETVRLIWQNSFQLFKSLLIFVGMSLWFLYALRALAEGLSRPRKEERFCAFWDRHPFEFPFLVLLAAYGWQIAIKYPGVIHLDVVMPIRMVLGLSPKNNTFPPTGTLLYGGAFLLGEKLGNVNWAYFAIMLFQSVSLMLTLSYALWLMHTRKAPRWVQLLALTLFAVNPIYIGWITTLGKDAQYMVWMLLLGVLMMEFLAEPEAFCRKKSRWVLLTADSLLAVLTRYNGVSVVVPCLVAMLIVLCRRPAMRRNIPCLLVCSALAFGLSAGANAAATRFLGLEEVRFYDYLSIPFQQTARVAKFYGGEGVTDEEKAAVDTMIAYDQLAERYDPAHADGVKTTVDVLERGKNSPKAYLRFWWKQLRQYPVDYLDAMLNMNYWMFDLQHNVPTYHSYADIQQYTYPYAFHETRFFNLEEIRPLMSWQRALTEWYFQFDRLPLIGNFASMGFCVNGMILLGYVSWILRRRNTLLTMIPSAITAAATLFCPEVYIRYLLPAMASLPLWLAALCLLAEKRAAPCQSPASVL